MELNTLKYKYAQKQHIHTWINLEDASPFVVTKFINEAI